MTPRKKDKEKKPFFWHRWQLGAMNISERRSTRKKNRKAERHAKYQRGEGIIGGIRQNVRAFTENFDFPAGLVVILASLVIAWPAQVEFYRGLGANTLTAYASAGLLEGTTWFLAVLTHKSIQRRAPAGVYRWGTAIAATIAGLMNFSHGLNSKTPLLDPAGRVLLDAAGKPVLQGGLPLGLLYLFASIGGVVAWELLMHFRKRKLTKIDTEQVKIGWWRRWYFRKVVRESKKIRATWGQGLTPETAWQLAYVRIEGAPTIPVPQTHGMHDAMLAFLRGDTTPPAAPAPAVTWPTDDTDVLPAITDDAAEPASTEPGSGSVATDEEPPAKPPRWWQRRGSSEPSSAGSVPPVPPAMEVPVDWSLAGSVDDVVAHFWTDTSSASSSGETSTPSSASSSLASSAPSSTPQEQPATSGNKKGTPPGGTPEQRAGEQGNPPLEPAERNPELPLNERLRNYFTRVEQQVELGTLNRKELATELGCSAKHVSNNLKKYLAERNSTPPEPAPATADPDPRSAGEPGA